MELKTDVVEKWWSLSWEKIDGGNARDDETEAEVSSMAVEIEMKKKKKKVITVSCNRFAMNEGFGGQRENVIRECEGDCACVGGGGGVDALGFY